MLLRHARAHVSRAVTQPYNTARAPRPGALLLLRRGGPWRVLGAGMATRGRPARASEEGATKGAREWVKPSDFIDLKSHLTDYTGENAFLRGPPPRDHRGPKPAAFMEYGAYAMASV
jgi:hypothetical protein